MYGVAADGNAVPASAHGAVRAPPHLLEVHALDLIESGSDRRLLVDGAHALAGFDGVEHN